MEAKKPKNAKKPRTTFTAEDLRKLHSRYATELAATASKYFKGEVRRNLIEATELGKVLCGIERVAADLGIELSHHS